MLFEKTIIGPEPKTRREKARAFSRFRRWMRREIINGFLILVGVVSASFGLKSFLLPNDFIDGGITGISLLISAIGGWSLPLLIIALNVPFVILGFTQIGKNFAVKTALGILALALCVATINFPILTADKLLVSVFGGFFFRSGYRACHEGWRSDRWNRGNGHFF